jgi:hypothetical protein
MPNITPNMLAGTIQAVIQPSTIRSLLRARRADGGAYHRRAGGVPAGAPGGPHFLVSPERTG